MRRTVAPALVAMGLFVMACHTITEELPNKPSGVEAPGSIPVIVVQIPVQTPAPAVPSPSSPNAPGANPLPPNTVPSPSSPSAPAPNPNPTPRATPVPPNNGGGEPPTTNNSPVARLNASVYFIECGGVPIPDTSRATTAPVGCRVHLDCTARDGSNSPTVPRGTPQWTFSPRSLITVTGNNAFNPAITGNGRGTVDIFAEVDGFRSATFSVTFE